jgi:hypothetical protein
MRPFVRVTVATGLALVAVLCASPSFATDTREAIKACDANPKCKFDVGKDGVVISVGGELIVCPIKNGPCGVMHMVVHQVLDISAGRGEAFQTVQ